MVFLADQLTKLVILSKYAIGQGIKINALLSFTHVQNTGAAFGLFSNKQIFLITIGILVVVIISIYRAKKPDLPTSLNIGLAFLMGGNLGNLSDRIFRGFVVDFIRLPYWPTFNIADITINIGVILISIYLIFTSETEEKNKTIDTRGNQE